LIFALKGFPALFAGENYQQPATRLLHKQLDYIFALKGFSVPFTGKNYQHPDYSIRS
jgi:hypothetical protein